MIEITDRMVHAFCDRLPMNQRPRQSTIKIALADAIRASDEISELKAQHNAMLEASKVLIDVAIRNTDDIGEWDNCISAVKSAIARAEGKQ